MPMRPRSKRFSQSTRLKSSNDAPSPGAVRFAYCVLRLEIRLGVVAKVAAIYCFGRPGQRLLGLMIRVMSCIIAHEPGTFPEFSSTTIVIRSDGR
jgi:hypothetical protein